ncbi:MAG: DUF2306 domain-containing protein [Gammaproteobacteria bacterium]|nr:DUF2306 domain-containing protein [Gammaproteobacteria bacterium]
MTIRTDAVSTGELRMDLLAGIALKRSAQLWFLTAVFGHWIFSLYIFGFYGPLLLLGGLEALDKTHLPGGYIPGDTFGNVASAAHILFSGIIMGGGPLQLIPQVRARMPSFHRWLGRIYMPSAVIASLTGLYMIWLRDATTIGSMTQHIGISLGGVLVIIFAAFALHHAMAGDIKTHRRWALRLFLTVSGVWFARVGRKAWDFLTGGAGIDYETFTGPFLDFWAFGQHLLPLAILELYFLSQDRAGPRGRIAMTVVIFTAAVLTGIGVFQASVVMWLPRL